MLTPDEPPSKQTFVRHEVEDDRHRLVVGNLIGEVDRRAFQVGGDPALPDSLGDRGAGHLEFAGRVVGIERRARRIGERDLDVRVALLERHADAGERSPGADRAHEPMQLAAEVVENLRPGRLVMAAPVGDVIELVRPHGAVRFGFGQRLGETPRIAHVIVGVGIGDCGNLDQLRAGKAQHVLLFLRLGVRDDDYRPIAERGRHHRDADSGVAGSALDDDAARAQCAMGDRVVDDRFRRAVLDRPARVHEFGLAQNRAPRRLGSGAELDKRRVADRGHDIAEELHRDPL